MDNKIYFWSLLMYMIIGCKQEPILFLQKKPNETGIDFVNHVIQTDSFNILTYPYILNGAGVAVGDIDNDGLFDLFFVGNRRGTNRLYKNKGNFQFSDISKAAGISGKSDWCTGVTMVDVNADGYLDIYVSTVSIPGQLRSGNELYINDGKGFFLESASTYGLAFTGHTTQSVFFDFDNDGDLDCFLLNHPTQYSDDYRTIEQRKISDSLSGDKLLENLNGKYQDITERAGIISSSLGYGLGVAVGDLNNDGWMDLYVSNDFKENDYCYINNQKGGFNERSKQLFEHQSRFSMGNDMADYNNDGWLDIITLDMLSPDEKILKSSVSDDDMGIYNYKHSLGFLYQFSRNCLQQNVDGKFFSDVALQKRIASTDWSWAPLMADFDNDGLKDLFVSNGFKYRLNDLDFNAFFQGSVVRNQQAGIETDKLSLINRLPEGKVADYFFLQKEDFFCDLSVEAGFDKPDLSNGAVYADLDNDGRLDLVVNRIDEAPGVFQNNMPKKNFLKVQLKGKDQNSFGIGATVKVYLGAIVQTFQQNPSRGFMSSVSPTIHVGLGSNSTVDSVEVWWPQGGKLVQKNIRANTELVFLESKSTICSNRSKDQYMIDSSWEELGQTCGIDFVHQEDLFSDLDVQPLLPHSIATAGPKLATSDINADGLTDFFVCGAKGQSGEIWMQLQNGSFKKTNQPYLEADSMLEETDALFFDADGDSDPDLYVTSGGNEYYGNNKLLLDQLYFNNGKGQFIRKNSIPSLFENKSCVAAGDFDKDGDLDLFVGGRANARMYGYIPSSVLLLNDGMGNFAEVTDKFSRSLQYVGMVTSATWTDIDKDGWQDLLIVGEWMPITIFKNNKGFLTRLSSDDLVQTEGWWNCIYKVDLDLDGDEDYLLGNWGTNSKLTSSKEHPILMYLSDWDKNGDEEPLLCVFKEGNYYSFLGKGDIEKRLPFLKKKYLHYKEIAGKSVEQLFTHTAIASAKKMKVSMLNSSVLWNEKGRLLVESLPSYLQTSPIFSFTSFRDRDGKNKLVAAGNFFDQLPFEGRYDALLPTIFEAEGKKIVRKGTILEKGAVRSMVSIISNQQYGLLLSRNNDALSFITKKIE